MPGKKLLGPILEDRPALRAAAAWATLLGSLLLVGGIALGTVRGCRGSEGTGSERPVVKIERDQPPVRRDPAAGSVLVEPNGSRRLLEGNLTASIGSIQEGRDELFVGRVTLRAGTFDDCVFRQVTSGQVLGIVRGNSLFVLHILGVQPSGAEVVAEERTASEIPPEVEEGDCPVGEVVP